MRAARRVATLALALAWGARAAAQEFAVAAPAGPGEAPGGFLESGLPPASAAPALETAFTRWFGLPGLETRAVAGAAGRGALRVAAGVAQMGEEEIGWNAAAVACGVRLAGGGAGLRAAARRDRAVEPGSAAAARLEARAGAEVGWGAWLEATPGLTLWAAVPQAWAVGVAPPLDRPLEIGARVAPPGPDGSRPLVLWLERSAPSRAGAADHGAGVSLAAGPLRVWGSARDRPLRGGVGVAAAAGRVRVAAGVDSHPELGETVRLALGLSAAPP